MVVDVIMKHHLLKAGALCIGLLTVLLTPLSPASAGTCFTLDGEERWDPRGASRILLQYEGRNFRVVPCTVQILKRNPPKSLEDFTMEERSASGLAVAVVRTQDAWNEQLAALERVDQLTPPVFRAAQRKELGKYESWTVYESQGPVPGMCHAEAKPLTKHPAPFAHGNVSLNIAAYPGSDNRHEFILLTGLDMDNGSDIRVVVEPEHLNGDGRLARASSPEQTERIIKAMQGATRVAVSVQGNQGPEFKYGFPLEGFNAALGRIRDCAGATGTGLARNSAE